MWIDSEQEKDNELPLQNTQNPSNPSVGAGGGTSSAPGTGASSNGNPANTGAAQGPSQSQSFATVQDYLKTNQPQAEDLGQKFTASLNDTLGTEKSSIDTAANKTQNDINSGVVNYNADLTNQALTNPTKVASDPNQLSAFQNQYNASYTGPQSFESSTNYTPAITAANEATTKAGELGTEGGREQLLQDQFNVYGQGNKGLDQALLQSSSAFPATQNQAGQFKSVQDYLNSQATNLDTAATNAANTTAATKTAAQGAFANNLTNFQNKLNSEVTAAQTQATTAGSAIQNDLKNGDGTALAKDLGAAGVSPENVQTISGYLQNLNKDYQQNPDLSNYFVQNPATNVNAANVATPEEYANAAAYKTLTGTDYSGVLNPSNVSQAGTATTTPQVNSAGLQTYLKGQLGQQDTQAVNNADYVAKNFSTLSPEDIATNTTQIVDALNRAGTTIPPVPKDTNIKGIAGNVALQNWIKQLPAPLQTIAKSVQFSRNASVNSKQIDAFFQALQSKQ